MLMSTEGMWNVKPDHLNLKIKKNVEVESLAMKQKGRTGKRHKGRSFDLIPPPHLRGFVLRVLEVGKVKKFEVEKFKIHNR